MPLFARKPKANPRTAPTGTSYKSSGINTARPAAIDVETGSSQPTVIREIVPQLASPFQRAQVYAQMMNYASVDVSMRLYKTPILGSEFFMEPYSDSPQDQEIAEFIWANLAEGMSSPFLSSLEDILGMYEDGWSLVEKVYERREWSPHRAGANTKQYIMLKKLAPRPVLNVKDITYDDEGGPKEITYNAIRADKTVEEVTLPIEQIIIFTFNKKGGDITGKSLLRTAYPHWYYMTHFYKIDAIQKERHAIGVPKGKMLPGAMATDKVALRTMLRNLRTNEESFIIETPTIEVTFEKPQGAMVDVLASAGHHNTMILMNVLGQFISLGSSDSGGGRATAATQSDMFMKSLKFVANKIAEQINTYLIPELVVWNYPTKNFPRLNVRNIGETRDIQMWAAAIANLYSQSALTAGHTPTENWIRKIIDAPSIPDSFVGPAKASGGVILPPDASASSSNGNSQRGGVADVIRTGNVGKPNNSPN